MGKILLISGTHGDERSGPIILFDYLRRNNGRPTGVEVIPLINPVGYVLNTRENGEGKDLNRWFHDTPRNGQPLECAVIRKYFESRTEPYDRLISFHEDPEAEGFYLYATNIEKESTLVQSIFRTARLHSLSFFTGLDDPDLNNEAGGNFVDGGFCAVGTDSQIPTLEEWLSRTGKVKEGITIEIPGALDLNVRIALGNMILETILRPTDDPFVR